ncbi:hypothetical protein TL16_g09624 [Triparma laevis f. inornata]|uniref:Uncharacterized protein n=2 Tax=Triparma laevis TaxID=1534972 RepID=A0A9W7L086_9STRA|nr:hypothetical protein TL16_g09624 [Triparma laevis f. inornata]GMI18467.1 hypothetical protein TrLO_g1173 [Triparma laevis f. longispina]
MSALIQQYTEKPTRLVAHVWYACMFLAVTDMIVACATASTNDDAGRAGSRGGAFAAIWSMFMIIGYVSSGTYILRKHKTASAIGFLLGMSFMISQLFFVLFVMFASFATTASEIDQEITDEHATSSVTSDRWFAAFSFFIFLVTAIFGVVLGKFRHDGIIPVSEMDATTAAGLGAKMPVQQGGSNTAV